MMKFGRYDYAAFMTFTVYAASSVGVPLVLVNLAHDLHFPLDEGGMSAGGILHGGRSLAIVFAMVFCGFVSGIYGKRRSLGWSVILMGLGIMLCAISPVYGVLFGALFFAGMGEGVIEGLATPFVQDLHPGEPGRYINFTHSFWSLGVLVTMLLCGALLYYGVSWRIILGGIGIVTMVPALMILLPEKEGREYPEHPEKLNPAKVWSRTLEILKEKRFWIFFAAMFVAGGGEFCLTFWCPAFIRLDIKGSAWASGVGTAFFALGMFAGRTGSGILVPQNKLRHLIIWAGIVGALVTAGLPMVGKLDYGMNCKLTVLYIALFLSGIASAPFWPSIQSYCCERMPKLDSTMLFILLSCAGVPGCGFFTWLMGYVGDRQGLTAAFFLVPGCYAIVVLLIAADHFLYNSNRARER